MMIMIGYSADNCEYSQSMKGFCKSLVAFCTEESERLYKCLRSRIPNYLICDSVSVFHFQPSLSKASWHSTLQRFRSSLTCLVQKHLRPLVPVRPECIVSACLTSLTCGYRMMWPTYLSLSFLTWVESFSVCNLFKMSTLLMWSNFVTPRMILSLCIHHVFRVSWCAWVRRQVFAP